MALCFSRDKVFKHHMELVKVEDKKTTGLIERRRTQMIFKDDIKEEGFKL